MAESLKRGLLPAEMAHIRGRLLERRSELQREIIAELEQEAGEGN